MLAWMILSKLFSHTLWCSCVELTALMDLLTQAEDVIVFVTIQQLNS